MTTDIILDDEGKEWITLAATAVKTTASDVIMDCPLRHTGTPGPRRALVHDKADGLTLNYNGDYPGGLTLNEAIVRLKVHRHLGHAVLPERGAIGELYAVLSTSVVMILVPVAVPNDAPHPFNPALAGVQLEPTIDPASAAGVLEPNTNAEGELSLWLCIGQGGLGQAVWQRIALGETIDGTI